MGQDQFSYSVEEDHMNSAISQEYQEKNRQYGIRTQYNKLWKGKGTTEISLAYSSLQNRVSDVQNSMKTGMGHSTHQQNKQTQNDISELKAKISGNFTLYPGHKTKFGVGLIRNSTILKEISNKTGISITFHWVGSLVNELSHRRNIPIYHATNMIIQPGQYVNA